MRTVRTNKPRSNPEPTLATQWDAFWHAHVAALRSGDPARILETKRAVDAFNARLGLRGAA